MDDPWKMLESAAVNALEPIWNELAKDGRESAAFAPMAQYPNAAAWLAGSMALSSDYITRKMGAMLAGWIHDADHAGLLSQMLEFEQKTYLKDYLSANSVAEDIMFAATRWTESQDPQIRKAGMDILAGMIKDALEGIPWNTVNWATANLYHATEGKHEVFRDLVNATDAQMEGQQFLQNVVKALKENDNQELARFVTAPSGMHSLSPDDPHYSVVRSLWKAAAAAEATLG